jgi:hypothetical protein
MERFSLLPRRNCSTKEIIKMETDIIYNEDCFMGSGTTALACKELNRRYKR